MLIILCTKTSPQRGRIHIAATFLPYEFEADHPLTDPDLLSSHGTLHFLKFLISLACPPCKWPFGIRSIFAATAFPKERIAFPPPTVRPGSALVQTESAVLRETPKPSHPLLAMNLRKMFLRLPSGLKACMCPCSWWHGSVRSSCYSSGFEVASEGSGLSNKFEILLKSLNSGMESGIRDSPGRFPPHRKYIVCVLMFWKMIHTRGPYSTMVVCTTSCLVHPFLFFSFSQGWFPQGVLF